MRVIIADIEQDVLRETAASIGAVGVPVDVSDLESVQALAKEATARFGTVHVVCNNAGIGPLAQIVNTASMAGLVAASWSPPNSRPPGRGSGRACCARARCAPTSGRAHATGQSTWRAAG